MKRPLALGAAGFFGGLGAAALVVFALPGWEWTPLTPNEGDAAAADAAGAEAEREVLYWRAPMDPNFTSDRPGKSPMGMDLVPVYADEAGALPEGAVRLDPTFLQRVGVRTGVVERRDLRQTIRTVGTLAHNDRQIAWVNTKFDGWVENVAVNYLGETVEEGQVLFDIYSPELVAAQNEYLQTRSYAERLDADRYPEVAARARSLVGAARDRLRAWDITDGQIAALEAEAEPRRTLSVLSPVTGVVVEKMDQALDGMFVRPGMNLYKLADLTTIWVDVEIFEHQVESMRIGQRAEVELPYLPGRTYTGTVRYLYPHFDQETRTMTVSVELANPELALRAGMYANVTFEVPVASGALVVPEEAVIPSGVRDLVVLEVAPGIFRVREVEVGPGSEGVVQIRRGLEEGDRIVISAQFLIDSESNLTQAVRALSREADGEPEAAEPDEPAMDGMEHHRHH